MSAAIDRVIAAGGRIGGYGGREVLKRALLVAEGVPISGMRVRSFARFRWTPGRHSSNTRGSSLFVRRP